MKSVLLIGIGRFGRHAARTLAELGHEVMAVDIREDRINKCLDYVTNAQIGSSTNEEFLRSLGPETFDLCLVTISNNFQSSLETTSLLKELGAKLVVSRAERDVQAKFLLRNGADHVVYPEKQMARWTAIRYISDNVLDFIDLDESNGIYEVRVPAAWIGKTISQIDIRKKYGINIVAIKNNGKITAVVDPDTMLTQDITLLVLGSNKNIQKCFHTGR
jgi:trk system potassium uptake protein TrkA